MTAAAVYPTGEIRVSFSPGATGRDEVDTSIPKQMPYPLPTPLTLRDWFAGKAIAGMLAGPGEPVIEKCATFAFQIADAMMTARGGGK